jgi:catecholate siderophore receptor
MFGIVGWATPARAQAAGAIHPLPTSSQLPAIQITAPETTRPANSNPTQRADRGARRPRSQTARRSEPTETPKAFAVSQDARTGTIGVYANSTSVATKTNTPLINIPQSVTVVTKDLIRDQSFQSLTDITRYVPGVAE